jgi:hypothetical protein
MFLLHFYQTIQHEINNYISLSSSEKQNQWYDVYTWVHVCACVLFIVWNWLVSLCSEEDWKIPWPALSKLESQELQSKCKGLRPRTAKSESTFQDSRKWCPSLKTVRQWGQILPYSVCLFCSGFQRIGWGPPIFGRQSVLFNLQIQMLSSSKTPSQTNPE